MFKQFISAVRSTQTICILVLLLNIPSTSAQSASFLPLYKSKTLDQQTLSIASDSGRLQITALKPNVIKVDYLKLGDSTDINSSNKKLNIRVTQNLDDVFLATDSLWVIINKMDLSIRFLKKGNEALLSRTFSYFINNQDNKLRFELDVKECTYLLAKKKIKSSISLKQKRSALYCGGKAMTQHPVLVSNKSYAIYIPEKNVTRNCKSTDQFQMIAQKPLTRFYFLSGDADEIATSLLQIP